MALETERYDPQGRDLATRSTLSGLTADEAREFNRFFIASFIVFIAICTVAHLLAYWWRPWLPSVNGYNGYHTSMLIHGVGNAAHALLSFS